MVSVTPSVTALTACLRHLDNEPSPKRLCELVRIVLMFASGAQRQLTVCYGTSPNVGARVNYRLAAYPPTAQLLLFMVSPVFLIVAIVLDETPSFNWMSATAYVPFPWLRMFAAFCDFTRASTTLVLRVAVRLANSGVASTVCLIFVKYCSVMKPRWMARWSRSGTGCVAHRMTRLRDAAGFPRKVAPFDDLGWQKLLPEDPIAVYTAIRFYHPAVHVVSWLYFAMLFWILPNSLVGMACFFPVFMGAGIVAGAFRRCLLWLREWLKRRTTLLVSRASQLRGHEHARREDVIESPDTAAMLNDATRSPHYASTSSFHAASDAVNAASAGPNATTHLVAVGVLKFIADQALPTIALVLSIQTALNYIVLALYSGHLVWQTEVYYDLGDPWWWNVVKVEYESRSVTCLASTIKKELSDGTQDVGHMWQIISAVVPFA